MLGPKGWHFYTDVFRKIVKIANVRTTTVIAKTVRGFTLGLLTNNKRFNKRKEIHQLPGIGNNITCTYSIYSCA